MIVGAAGLKSSGQARRLASQGRADPAVRVQRQSAGRNLSCLGEVSFHLVRPSPVWVRPTHITESNLLYLKSTDFNVIFI